jgi:hypothetical protein
MFHYETRVPRVKTWVPGTLYRRDAIMRCLRSPYQPAARAPRPYSVANGEATPFWNSGSSPVS